ncbi:MAG: endonuclease/exonuclease/phosphatase family protein [Planctomycetota bacterium]
MLRVATFNVENLDDTVSERNPSLDARAPYLRAALQRLDADILCLQEVHGQELTDHTSNSPSRNLESLDFILQGTKYESFQRSHTVTTDGVPYNERNLVVVSSPQFAVLEVNQYRNDHIDKLQYRKVTSVPADASAKNVSWERPILHVVLDVTGSGPVHVLNLHLKSRLASNIEGQKEGFSWRSAAGWAEGYFLSSIKRVGQALETRLIIDRIFDSEPGARILVCGDFNAEPGEVPVEAISGRVENTNNSDLRSRVLVACSNSIPESIRFSHLHHGQGNLLDHILVSQEMFGRFVNAEIHNESLHDESLPFAFDVKYPDSDHAGFVAKFQ